jgi:hypothetical protein
MKLLEKVVAEWEKVPLYSDVKAAFLDHPSEDQMVESCPHGCVLQIHGETDGIGPWREMEEYVDYYRQTRFCREHGFARIYVTTGLKAFQANYEIH